MFLHRYISLKRFISPRSNKLLSFQSKYYPSYYFIQQISSMSTLKKQELSPYVPEKIWSDATDLGGAFAHMNRPTAGARFEKKLPVGDHKLQLYSLATPNGQKVGIMLEELNDLKDVEYDAWIINIGELDQFGDEFVSINPNSKIPALRDLDGPDGKPINVFETASILLYLAEKYKAFLPTDARKKTECMNWLFWLQGAAPYIGGGFGHFYKYAPVKIEYAINRFAMETKRLLSVLENQFKDGRSYITGDEITIADFNIMPWVKCVRDGYHAAEYLSLDADYPYLNAYILRVLERPAVQRGMVVTSSTMHERHSKADFK